MLAAAVDRAAETLARTEHAPAEEVRRGLRQVLELLSRARAESAEFTLAFGAGVPRSHVDALRGEFLNGLEHKADDSNGAGSGRPLIATAELVGILTAMERISGQIGRASCRERVSFLV